ncbi:hypothetical protein F4802DRAFT_584010 [Xylaria palmicola]|nr:hypothetical protein F4802DRAFT_584010 [Xylaria palmicola]
MRCWRLNGGTKRSITTMTPSELCQRISTSLPGPSSLGASPPPVYLCLVLHFYVTPKANSLTPHNVGWFLFYLLVNIVTPRTLAHATAKVIQHLCDNAQHAAVCPSGLQTPVNEEMVAATIAPGDSNSLIGNDFPLEDAHSAINGAQGADGEPRGTMSAPDASPAESILAFGDRTGPPLGLLGAAGLITDTNDGDVPRLVIDGDDDDADVASISSSHDEEEAGWRPDSEPRVPPNGDSFLRADYCYGADEFEGETAKEGIRSECGLISGFQSLFSINDELDFHCPGLPIMSLTDIKPDIKLATKVVSWSPKQFSFRLRREGIVSEEKRDVVPSTEVSVGQPMSGILKIVSLFHDHDGRWWRIEGTAVAISDFDFLTSAHNIWHPKLGPAKMIGLLMDERGDQGDQHAIACLAGAAVHHAWVNSTSSANDFGIVTVKEPIHSGISRFSCANKPLAEDPTDVSVVGYPGDMPKAAKGKQLCSGPGKAEYNKSEEGGMIVHTANTATGVKFWGSRSHKGESRVGWVAQGQQPIPQIQ